MLVPHVFVHQAELQADIAKASGMLGPEVVSFTYRLDTDSTGDPAIYFHIVLQDWATTEDLIGDVTGPTNGDCSPTSIGGKLRRSHGRRRGQQHKLAYHDDLLSWAISLAQHTPSSKASLRRAVSTAYYAVFNLLIAESTANWLSPELRNSLARAFDHGPMKQASKAVANAQTSPFAGEDPRIVADLRLVAQTFVQLQDQRHIADYDLRQDLEESDARAQVKSAEKVFQVWPAISSHKIAQEYLVALVVRR